MIELVALCLKTGFDIAQALPIGQLREGHASILILARKPLDVVVAIVALNTPSKSVQRKVFHRLCENEFACVHRPTATTLIARLERGAS